MTKSIRERIYERIRDDITYSRVLPGERLTENRLVEELGASRTPIREALRQLETEGMLTFERNKGITFTKLSPQQVDEIYNIGAILASYAVRLCVERISESDLKYLRNIERKTIKAAKDGDWVEYQKQNRFFHDRLVNNCGNSNLIQVLNNLNMRVYRYQYLAIRTFDKFDTFLSQHRKILEACEAKDGEKASEYMKLHQLTVRDVIIKLLKMIPL